MRMTYFYRIKLALLNIVPREILDPLRAAYHFSLAIIGASLCRFPSRSLIVIGVTGTKGKSSVVEMIGAIFEKAGHRVALLDSIRIKVGGDSRINTMRMSMPGRFFLQRFLARARDEGCDVAIIEMTSEGARQYRHRAIALNALVFTNLAPEHIESHGSFEEYANAKYELGLQLLRSRKRPRIMVANADDPASGRFLTLPIEHALPFSLTSDATHTADEKGGHFRFDDAEVSVPLPGEFSLKNALAAATLARAFGIKVPTIESALSELNRIPGRAERIEEGQDFIVVVDYAHTPDSLAALYDAYKNVRKICVLGATGGGRDQWKRPVMGKIASEHCDTVILTNEDPYDEDPRSIIEAVARGMQKEPTIVLDRREAIQAALRLAAEKTRLAQGTHEHWAVLVSGKGTDPTINGPRGTAIPWNDADVAREELRKLFSEKK